MFVSWGALEFEIEESKVQRKTCGDLDKDGVERV